MSVYKAMDQQDAFDKCEALLNYGGPGHTAAIQTQNMDLAREFGVAMKASRIIVTLPVRTRWDWEHLQPDDPIFDPRDWFMGENSISHNVTDYDLLNVKTIAKRRNNMQWIKLPRAYFERDSVRYLKDMPGIKRVLLLLAHQFKPTATLMW